MERREWRGGRSLAAGVIAAAALVAASGCQDRPEEGATRPRREVNRPRRGPSIPTGRAEPAAAQAEPSVSWDTDRDAQFARFLRGHSGGLIRQAAVGLDRRGTLRVEVSQAAAPDDILPLTKSLLAGARKDFPDRPLTVSVYDPGGEPVLHARYRPDAGVRYQLAQGNGETPTPDRTPAPTSKVDTDAPADPLNRGGVTARDRAFARWAERHGRPLLRYVEADLERHGRLWFGITGDVTPGDVRPLTKSLLEGARDEFPKGELVATVFDPDGERIGRARLEPGGELRWEH